MKKQQFTLGIIEGFYGKPWSWADRESCVEFMQEYNYQFYIYAPKSDFYLREKWQDNWPEETFRRLTDFSASCRKKGLRFGIGLSPFEVYKNFDRQAKASLHRKIMSINQLFPDILCILFDDMKGEEARLAAAQAAIFDFVTDHSSAKSFILCPTYYAFDPILEKIYGKMPPNYLTDLGKLIDLSADIFWTGTRVCSTEYTESHLSEVADMLGRKPFIWDNYPVNDGSRMSQFLHLRAFDGRPHQMSEWIAAHGVNPMNQAYLSRIPLRSLTENYALKDQYNPEHAFFEAARVLCGQELGACLMADIALFQDKGLNKMGKAEKKSLIRKYEAFQSPFAQEIVNWLKGSYEYARQPQ